MRLRRIHSFAAAGALLVWCVQPAGAWSSSASRSEGDIRELAATLEVYRGETGVYPNTNEYWLTLQAAGHWYEGLWQSGPVHDQWGRPLVYRLPGKHGNFDLYSVGPDGMDNEGRGDDVSSWAGVNDGYHWKETWPRGRLTLRIGLALAVLVSLFGFVFSWRVVLPIAGMVLCISIIYGCSLLMHPGVVRYRNTPLTHAMYLGGLVCTVLLVVLVLDIRSERLRRGRGRSVTERSWPA